MAELGFFHFNRLGSAARTRAYSQASPCVCRHTRPHFFTHYPGGKPYALNLNACMHLMQPSCIPDPPRARMPHTLHDTGGQVRTSAAETVYILLMSTTPQGNCLYSITGRSTFSFIVYNWGFLIDLLIFTPVCNRRLPTDAMYSTSIPVSLLTQRIHDEISKVLMLWDSEPNCR